MSCLCSSLCRICGHFDKICDISEYLWVCLILRSFLRKLCDILESVQRFQSISQYPCAPSYNTWMFELGKCCIYTSFTFTWLLTISQKELKLAKKNSVPGKTETCFLSLFLCLGKQGHCYEHAFLIFSPLWPSYKT